MNGSSLSLSLAPCEPCGSIGRTSCLGGPGPTCECAVCPLDLDSLSVCLSVCLVDPDSLSLCPVDLDSLSVCPVNLDSVSVSPVNLDSVSVFLL